MTSLYGQYTILHDRNGAQAWKGGYDPTREADIYASSLADAMGHIDVEEGYLAAHKDVVVPV